MARAARAPLQWIYFFYALALCRIPTFHFSIFFFWFSLYFFLSFISIHFIFFAISFNFIF